jgi:probable addiction module antidote protein
MSEKVTFSKWDPADYIETPEDAIKALEFAIEENDIDFLLSTIGDICRSESMAEIARKLNIDRVNLYKFFSPDGDASFKTVSRLLNILGLRLKLEKKSA